MSTYSLEQPAEVWLPVRFFVHHVTRSSAPLAVVAYEQTPAGVPGRVLVRGEIEELEGLHDVAQYFAEQTMADLDPVCAELLPAALATVRALEFAGITS